MGASARMPMPISPQLFASGEKTVGEKYSMIIVCVERNTNIGIVAAMQGTVATLITIRLAFREFLILL